MLQQPPPPIRILYYPAPRWALASLLGESIAPPPVISQTTGPISKTNTPFDSSAREYSKHGEKFDLDVTVDVAAQVKVRMFYFSDLVTSASTIFYINLVRMFAWADSRDQSLH